MARNPEDEEEDRPLLPAPPPPAPEPRRNVLWTVCPFILGNEFCERLAFYGLATNLVSYLSTVMGADPANASVGVMLFEGSCYLSPLLGAYLADSLWGRYRTIQAFSIVYLFGMVALALSAWSAEAAFAAGGGANLLATFLPRRLLLSHDPGIATASALNDQPFKQSLAQHLALWGSLSIVALGTGGIKPNVSAFGADQFDETHDRAARASFWNFFYLSVNLGSLIACTAIVYVQDSVSWALGFAIPAMAMALAVLLFLAGAGRYRHVPPTESPMARVYKVVRAALRNRAAQRKRAAAMAAMAAARPGSGSGGGGAVAAAAADDLPLLGFQQQQQSELWHQQQQWHDEAEERERQRQRNLMLQLQPAAAAGAGGAGGVGATNNNAPTSTLLSPPLCPPFTAGGAGPLPGSEDFYAGRGAGSALAPPSPPAFGRLGGGGSSSGGGGGANANNAHASTRSIVVDSGSESAGPSMHHASAYEQAVLAEQQRAALAIPAAAAAALQQQQQQHQPTPPRGGGGNGAAAAQQAPGRSLAGSLVNASARSFRWLEDAITDWEAASQARQQQPGLGWAAGGAAGAAPPAASPPAAAPTVVGGFSALPTTSNGGAAGGSSTPGRQERPSPPRPTGGRGGGGLSARFGAAAAAAASAAGGETGGGGAAGNGTPSAADQAPSTTKPFPALAPLAAPSPPLASPPSSTLPTTPGAAPASSAPPAANKRPAAAAATSASPPALPLNRPPHAHGYHPVTGERLLPGGFTKRQVHEVKLVLRLLPIFFTTAAYWTIYAQMGTFFIQQGSLMDNRIPYPSQWLSWLPGFGDGNGGGSGDRLAAAEGGLGGGNNGTALLNHGGHHSQAADDQDYWFRLPSASMALFNTAAIIALVPLYDGVVDPWLRRRGQGLTLLRRIGWGMGIAALAMGYAAGVEKWRRDAYWDSVGGRGGSGGADPSPPSPPPSSSSSPQRSAALPLPRGASPVGILWLAPAYVLVGASEVLASVGQLEFFYDQAPDVMRSCSMALQLLSTAIGSYLGGGLVALVQTSTRALSPTGTPWLPRDLNEGHLDLFLLLMGALMVVNLLGFLVVAASYEYKAVEHVASVGAGPAVATAATGTTAPAVAPTTAPVPVPAAAAAPPAPSSSAAASLPLTPAPQPELAAPRAIMAAQPRPFSGPRGGGGGGVAGGSPAGAVPVGSLSSSLRSRPPLPPGRRPPAPGAGIPRGGAQVIPVRGGGGRRDAGAADAAPATGGVAIPGAAARRGGAGAAAAGAEDDGSAALLGRSLAFQPSSPILPPNFR